MALAVVCISFFVLLFIGFPICISMGLAGVIGILIMPDVGARVLAQKVYSGGDSFALMAMPFFMLGGQIMEVTGITEQLVNFAKKLVGWMRGGLAYTTTVAGVLMAGISGSANADTAALGAITLKPLIKEGWSEGMAVSIVSTAGGLGPIIPPSIFMIIYCSIANVSVGAMFMAGYIPGIMLAVMYMVIAGIYAKKHNMKRQKFGGFKDLLKTFGQAFWALLMPIIIIGSILSGLCTATEAGVISAVYGIFYGFITRKLTFKKLLHCAREAALNSAGPMAIIIMAGIVGYIFTTGGLSQIMEAWFTSVSDSKYVFGLLVILICTIAGMFLDGAATMLILIPILLPISQHLGMGIIHFSMVYMIGGCSGGITPPVGAQLFITCSMGGIKLKNCIKAIIPYVIVDTLAAVIILFVPFTVEFLPKLFGYPI